MEYRNTFHIIWYNITIWYGNIAILYGTTYSLLKYTYNTVGLRRISFFSEIRSPLSVTTFFAQTPPPPPPPPKKTATAHSHSTQPHQKEKKQLHHSLIITKHRVTLRALTCWRPSPPDATSKLQGHLGSTHTVLSTGHCSVQPQTSPAPPLTAAQTLSPSLTTQGPPGAPFPSVAPLLLTTTAGPAAAPPGGC